MKTRVAKRYTVQLYGNYFLLVFKVQNYELDLQMRSGLIN